MFAIAMCHSAHPLLGLTVSIFAIAGIIGTYVAVRPKLSRKMRTAARVAAVLLLLVFARTTVGYAEEIIKPDVCLVYDCRAGNCGIECWWYWCPCDPQE